MNRFIMMIGLPGSGKDTWIEQYKEKINSKITVICPDDIRKELYGKRSIQGDSEKVFGTAYKRLRNALVREEEVIFNATNMKRKNRQAALDIVKTFKDYIIYSMIIATPLSQCIANNEARGRENKDAFVPVGIIQKMYRYYEPPAYFEGFNKIEVVYPFMKPYIYFPKKAKELEKFDQDNPHHDYSLGAHMRIAAKKCKQDLKKGKIQVTDPNDPLKDYWESVLIKGLQLHDIGKEYTKVYHDKKGNPTEYAHYYEHANVGAYEYMWYQLDKDYYSIFEEEFDPNVAAVIAYHMRPFQWKQPKTVEKYRKLFGDKLFRVIELVHEYDVKATKKD